MNDCPTLRQQHDRWGNNYHHPHKQSPTTATNFHTKQYFGATGQQNNKVVSSFIRSRDGPTMSRAGWPRGRIVGLAERPNSRASREAE